MSPDLTLPEGLELRRDERGLALVGDGMELRGDLSRMLPRLRPANLHRELLVRAARARGVDAPTAVDATAGLGEDALLLAAAGFAVTLCERDAVIAALLRDALQRAAADARLAETVARMTLVEGDAIATLGQLGTSPDLVFLDPMFPERRRHAATNKKLALFQRLERTKPPMPLASLYFFCFWGSEAMLSQAARAVLWFCLASRQSSANSPRR